MVEGRKSERSGLATVSWHRSDTHTMSEQPHPESVTVDFESMARLLDDHDNYRVCRRLPDRQKYHDHDGCAIKRGLILDTETTGAVPSKDKVIEIALLLFEYDPETGRVFRIVESLSALEDPGIPIPAEATAIHGICQADVTGKTFDEAAVRRIAAQADLVIAHNAEFDRPFVEERFPIFQTLAWACSCNEIDWLTHGFGTRKLDLLALQSRFFYDAHRAEADCRAVLEMLQQRDTDDTLFLKHLQECAGQASYRIWATNAPYESKDQLKARGYRFDGLQKTWHISLPEDDAKRECRWLFETIYRRHASIRLDIQDATTRFTGRLTSKQHRL